MAKVRRKLTRAMKVEMAPTPAPDDYNQITDDNAGENFGYYENQEKERSDLEAARLAGLTSQELAKEYNKEAKRHDTAIDRGDFINLTAIENARMRMNLIESTFKDRGLNYLDFIFKKKEEAD